MDDETRRALYLNIKRRMGQIAPMNLADLDGLDLVELDHILEDFGTALAKRMVWKTDAGQRTLEILDTLVPWHTVSNSWDHATIGQYEFARMALAPALGHDKDSFTADDVHDALVRYRAAKEQS